jgi:citrate synthase
LSILIKYTLPMRGMIDSQEAARRLGVKTSSLYAYVSRGLLTSHPSPSGRRSLFDLKEVEQLAERSRGSKRVETRLTTIATSVTRLGEDGPLYRGVPATSLAADTSFEKVAELLWQTGPGSWEPVSIDVPRGLRSRDLIRSVVSLTAARDPVRSDLRTEAVVRAARRLIATIVTALPGRRALGNEPRSIADLMADRLGARERSPQIVSAINVALVLFADHELATSTLAVRFAASTRADIYDGVLAGLGVLGGPLHGAASELAHGLIVDVVRYGADRAVDDALRLYRHLPGFGHPVYRSGDPRFELLYTTISSFADEQERCALDSLIEVAAAHNLPMPNADLALAALVYVLGAPKESGPTIFTVARIAGWIAHYLEELREPALRFRSRAVYVTPSDGFVQGMASDEHLKEPE